MSVIDDLVHHFNHHFIATELFHTVQQPDLQTH